MNLGLETALRSLLPIHRGRPAIYAVPAKHHAMPKSLKERLEPRSTGTRRGVRVGGTESARGRALIRTHHRRMLRSQICLMQNVAAVDPHPGTTPLPHGHTTAALGRSKFINMKLADFVIIGAMKCATGTLHGQLSLQTKAVEVELKMPKLRRQTFETAIIEGYRRREISDEEAIVQMNLAGVSVNGFRQLFQSNCANIDVAAAYS